MSLAYKCLISVIAMWHLSVSSGDCCHYEIPPAYSSTLGFTHCAQLWSQGIKVNSNQTGCGVEQGLMGLYTLLFMQGAIGDQTEAAWMEVRWGDDGAETARVRERERDKTETETIWLIMWVAGHLLGRGSAVLLWQYAFLPTPESWARAPSAVWALFKKQWRSGP